MVAVCVARPGDDICNLGNKKLLTYYMLIAILRQLFAQSRHACTHMSMRPMRSQLTAHSSQIAAQTAHC